MNGNKVRNRIKQIKFQQNGDLKNTEEIADTEFVIRESILTVLLENSMHIRAIYHIFFVILLILFFDTVIYDFVERGKINIGLSVIANGFGDLKRGVSIWLFQLSVALVFYPGLRIYAFIAKRLIKYPGILSYIFNHAMDKSIFASECCVISDATFFLAFLTTRCLFGLALCAFQFTTSQNLTRLRALPLNIGVPIGCFICALRALSLLGVAGVVALQATLVGVPVWNVSKNQLALATCISITCEMFRFAMKVHAVVVACGPRCHGEKLPLPPFKHYVYFLFAPTLIYRDQYPRTKKIRWSLVLCGFMEVAMIIFYNSFLWERFILPNWSDYGKKSRVEAGIVIRNMFACVLPGMISFLSGFYGLLQAWQNAFAEMLTFGDRLFYEDWWTVSRFSRYYRAWNRIVHSWLRDCIYVPLAPHAGRAFSTFFVFLLSAVAHELILALSFGFFYPVLLMQFGVVGVLMVPISGYCGRRFPNAVNLFMWFSFFLGTGMIWSLYPMEHFARKNCPRLASDSFFIPKSWSCPELVLKPNWTFQNPLDIIY